jgi:predicted O-methyltransferase YrrM
VSFDIAEYEHRLSFWSDIGGHMPFLRQTAESYAEPVIIELGVRSGQSMSAFLAGIQGNGGRLWSVDCDPPQVPAHWHDLPEWRFLQADDVGAQAREWLPQACDLLFIDTSHEFRHTVTELFLHVPRVKPGGIVLLHDTEWAPDGDEQMAEPGGPVAEALDVYCAGTGLSWVNRAGSYGMGVLKR